MNRTGIGWTGWTWNPVTGCEKISPGCAYCYADTVAENRRGTKAFPVGFDLMLHPDRLDQPRKMRGRQLIFVDSMNDLFWERVPFSFVDKVVDVIEDTPHEYQVLTKRVDRMLAYSRRRRLPPNFWAVASVEGERYARERIPLLLQIEAHVRGLSCEPCLELTWLAPYMHHRENEAGGDGVAWVVFGGESGSHINRSMAPGGREDRRALVRYDAGRKLWTPKMPALDWARRQRDDVGVSGGAFFLKQWGGPTTNSGGRELDGRTHDEMPLPGLLELTAVGRRQLEVVP